LRLELFEHILIHPQRNGYLGRHWLQTLANQAAHNVPNVQANRPAQAGGKLVQLSEGLGPNAQQAAKLIFKIHFQWREVVHAGGARLFPELVPLLKNSSVILVLRVLNINLVSG